MTAVLEWLGALLALGGALLFLGSGIGLVRFPDFYTRLHAPTKAASLGLLLFALASIVRYPGPEHAAIAIRQLILIAMVVVTVPISAQMLMRAAVAQRVRQDPRTRGIASIEPPDRDDRLPHAGRTAGCPDRTDAGRDEGPPEARCPEDDA